MSERVRKMMTIPAGTFPLYAPGDRVVWMREDGGFVTTSSMVNSTTQETACGVSDEYGCFLSRASLGVAAPGDHEGALRNAGFEVEMEVAA